LKEDFSIHCFAASIFGLGRSPVAPGSVATLVAGVPFFIAVGCFSWPVLLAIDAALFWAGWYVSGKAERQLGKTDPPEVVIDELCGYMVAMTGHPVSFASICCGFLLFRLFDIWKPWPIRYVEKNLRGGASIMLDDVLAGVCANILGFIFLKLLSS
jgi:phosphatidylglycerophosphatase A